MQLVNDNVVRDIATTELAYRAIERAFLSLADREASLCPVVTTPGSMASSSVAIKTGSVLPDGLLGFKLGSYFPSNSVLGLNCHQSTTVLIDAKTGFPRALISGTHLNGLRTAAADAVAVDHLARKDARVMGVIGAGHQAAYDIRAVAEVRSLDRIKIWSRSAERVSRLVQQLADIDIAIEPVGLEEAVRNTDIVLTLTPSTQPLVQGEWLSPGTHISAMGSDQVGKRELDTEAVARAWLFADLPDQSRQIGELQYLSRRVDNSTITAIGEVINNRLPGRNSEDAITLFDSSGIAVQDLYIADAVLEQAISKGLATELNF